MGSTLDTEVGRWMLDTIRSRILRDMTEKFLINSIDRVGRSLSLLFIPIYSALSDIWVVIHNYSILTPLICSLDSIHAQNKR